MDAIDDPSPFSPSLALPVACDRYTYWSGRFAQARPANQGLRLVRPSPFLCLWSTSLSSHYCFPPLWSSCSEHSYVVWCVVLCVVCCAMGGAQLQHFPVTLCSHLFVTPTPGLLCLLNQHVCSQRWRCGCRGSASSA